ncbi:MAG: AMIN domain-containing protein, partial [Myxococcota bacterium]
PAPAPVAPAPAPAPVAAAPVEKPAPRREPPAAPKPVKAAPAPVKGALTLGAPVMRGNQLVLPISGVKKVERHFTLKGPDRVVVDLAANSYSGPTELKGKGPISRIRVGNRPGGVRLVLDVLSARLASTYKVTGSNGSVSVAVASR